MSQGVRALKVELRREMVDRILSLATEERWTQEERLRRTIGSLPGYHEAETILLYLDAFPEEIPTRPFCVQARAEGKRVLLPTISRRPRRLRLFEVEDLETDLVLSRIGIAEPRTDRPEAPPESVDWALIPGLAFDPRGYRLGRGGGYYDRLIPSLRSDATCWGLGYDCQLVPAVPTESHDAPIHGVTVPSGSYRRFP